MRVNSRARLFAVAAIAFLALALLVLVLPSEVEAKRVAAKKIGFPTLPTPFSTPPLSKPLSRSAVNDPRCMELSGPISEHIVCTTPQGAKIIGDVRIYDGGWLDIQGTTLTFEGPFKLEVYNFGKFTLDSTNVLLGQRSVIGYQITTQSQAVVSIVGTEQNPTTMTRADYVALDAENAQIDYLHYYGNAKGLVLTARSAVVDHSKFYNNHDCGLKIYSSARYPITVRNSGFYAGGGEQKIGILLENSQNALLEGNDVHDNSKAGIKLFASYEGNARALQGKALDMTPAPVPNTLRGNQVHHNADGVIEYTVANQIENPELIDYNTNYGFVGIDVWNRNSIQQGIGVNNGAKMLYSTSTRVGALVFDSQTQRQVLPDGPVYVAACEGDVYDCDGPNPMHSDARHYDDYAIEYMRVLTTPRYFTSDLMTENHIENIRGVPTYFTPRFLMRDHSVDNSNNVVYYCLDSQHGYPSACAVRAVTLYRGVDDYGHSSEGWPRRVQGDEYDYYIFYDSPRGHLALRFGWDAGKGNKQVTIQLPNARGRRTATKIVSVPELRAVKTPPKYSDAR